MFDGINRPENEEIKYYYPTNDLVTGPDILFFWVARMIIAGYEYRGEMPFRNVYLTGIVRDKLRRKMSKSLGNSPDPLDLIEQYGADGVRPVSYTHLLTRTKTPRSSASGGTESHRGCYPFRSRTAAAARSRGRNRCAERFPIGGYRGTTRCV